MPTARVYLNIGQTFYNAAPLPDTTDFSELIDTVAKRKRIYYRKGKEISLLNWRGGPSRRKTRAYIIRETNSLIHQLGRFQCQDENMLTRTSQMQLKELERALHCRGKGIRISGYALLIFYVIYGMIRDGTNSQDDMILQQLADYIKTLVGRYYQYNQTDRVARFLLASYDPVSRVFLDRQAALPSTGDFPAIPRKQVINW